MERRVLNISNLQVYYGAIRALDGISLEVHQGEIVTMIGANGAGKSTTIRTISGLVRPRRGEVLLEGKPIHNMQPHEIVAAGVGQAPEGRRIFANMTVRDNLTLGAYSRERYRDQVRADM